MATILSMGLSEILPTNYQMHLSHSFGEGSKCVQLFVVCGHKETTFLGRVKIYWDLRVMAAAMGQLKGAKRTAESEWMPPQILLRASMGMVQWLMLSPQKHVSDFVQPTQLPDRGK